MRFTNNDVKRIWDDACQDPRGRVFRIARDFADRVERSIADGGSLEIDAGPCMIETMEEYGVTEEEYVRTNDALFYAWELYDQFIKFVERDLNAASN